MKISYLYAIKDTRTNKLVNAKCGGHDKFYMKKALAEKRCSELNKYNANGHKVVTFEIKEVENT